MAPARNILDARLQKQGGKILEQSDQRRAEWQERSGKEWQERSGKVLEPNERIEAVAAGAPAFRGLSWLPTVAFLPRLLNRMLNGGRVYIVTDRNVYVCRTGARGTTPTEVLAKRPLADARLDFKNEALTMDGDNPLAVGPVNSSHIVDVIAAARAGRKRPDAGASSEP